MKQIKTIMVKTRDVEDLVEFDEKVNAAMAEGWTLDKREALQVQEVGIVCILYAELTRKIVEEKPGFIRMCVNCRHFDDTSDTRPCLNCDHNYNKWEAENA